MTAELDPVIHPASRLRIMTTLVAAGEGKAMPFALLAERLDMTPGNLSVHLTKLETAGYVRIDKTFRGRKPATYAVLTHAGGLAFARYLTALKTLLDPVREGVGDNDATN
ncbi:MarR family transcriptional regulator [Bifidobacterium sp. DSM 109958]|uniref:MarR family transcriptional regulator n=1 Tax=Bifidobacterium moraviense TaxID=2675323 RepID=A0A7Y0F252_9BIFI|nr:transcriptional regulator [Bifidobacterium sp. DSM 109958]NMM99701.1 MarR family transcriptional regulator [Bifidobacterium sp. DSM 109958]